MPIPLKCCLKCTPGNVDEIYEKKPTLLLTAFGPEIGFLTSEGYPYTYPRNADNISTYPIPEGWYMNIYFRDFDVEESRYCL